MPQDSNPRKPGDSAPNFDWLNDQVGSGVGGKDSRGDSRLGVLPENQSGAAGESGNADRTAPSTGEDSSEESPSSIFSDEVPSGESGVHAGGIDPNSGEEPFVAEAASVSDEAGGPDVTAEDAHKAESSAASGDDGPRDMQADRDDDDTLYDTTAPPRASAAEEETVRMELPAEMSDPPRHRPASTTASGSKNGNGSGKPGPKYGIVVLASYASAITLVAVYLWLKLASAAAHPHHLESLPDVKPIPDGQFSEYDAAASMPAGHTLKLGESQTFGSIEVEVLRVTEDPIRFTHFSGDASRKRSASEPVLKLWLRFTNVSDEQVVVPLDAELLLKRAVNSNGEMLANNFVIRAEDKPAGEPRVFLFDHPMTSEWDLAQQELGRALEPGESFETYIPSAMDGLDQLDGDLLWRVHFRKGHSPKGYGVTTLIEVAFSRSDVSAATTGAQPT
ncbi:hypothetical protein Mal4_46200 [Maioricimonas rarisocia]|uniref:Uncharacterized protein n=1 Tax=Maioricimonas rarisocia TaxID=2528026 RepID=A0A517ZCN9_9PLAN|nr:hypothetical protein [Maioricimonas rarisocia]QDU40264.1 hypothetical protein Mal4_46200 [Maioricimonas rarisocia]